MSMRRREIGFASLALGLLAHTALGQFEEDEILPPTVGQAPIRIEPTIVVPSISTGTRAVLPGEPTPSDAIAGLLGEDIAVPLGRLLPEGTFLVQRVGGLVRARTGEWIFISSPDESGRRDPPMVLLPSATLEELEGRVADNPAGVRVMLSGQVLVYHDRNYLLPTLFAVTREQPEDPPQNLAQHLPDPVIGEIGAQSGEPESTAGSVRSSDPRVAALLEQLEREGGLTANLDRPFTSSNAERGEAMLNDGKLVIRQRGRVTRLVNGRLALSADQDDAKSDPIVLLPSSTLAEMESAIARTGESRAVILSGRHYIHRGRRYLLPISFFLAPPSDLKSMQ